MARNGRAAARRSMQSDWRDIQGASDQARERIGRGSTGKKGQRKQWRTHGVPVPLTDVRECFAMFAEDEPDAPAPPPGSMYGTGGTLFHAEQSLGLDVPASLAIAGKRQAGVPVTRTPLGLVVKYGTRKGGELIVNRTEGLNAYQQRFIGGLRFAPLPEVSIVSHEARHGTQAMDADDDRMCGFRILAQPINPNRPVRKLRSDPRDRVAREYYAAANAESNRTVRADTSLRTRIKAVRKRLGY